MKSRRGQFVECCANILLDNQCTSVRSFGRMEGEGDDDEGVDLANSLGCYCWSRLVVRGLDRRKRRIHEVVHILLSSNKQIIQLKCNENLRREGQCQMKTVHLSLRIPPLGLYWIGLWFQPSWSNRYKFELSEVYEHENPTKPNER